jgi:hypothetical protein
VQIADISVSEITNNVINKRNVKGKFEVHLYRNPTSNSRNEKEIIMYDEIGQVVYRKITIEGEHMIDVTTDKYSNGLYLIQITQGKKSFLKK